MKLIDYEESHLAAYELNGCVYSAYQRREVVGRWIYRLKNGHEIVVSKPIRKWGKKEVELEYESNRLNKERLKDLYKRGLIGNKQARIYGLI